MQIMRYWQQPSSFGTNRVCITLFPVMISNTKIQEQKGVAFDFEGSMIRGVANHYKQFGSTATIYYSVEKYYKWYFWFANAYNWLREIKIR